MNSYFPQLDKDKEAIKERIRKLENRRRKGVSNWDDLEELAKLKRRLVDIEYEESRTKESK